MSRPFAHLSWLVAAACILGSACASSGGSTGPTVGGLPRASGGPTTPTSGVRSEAGMAAVTFVHLNDVYEIDSVAGGSVGGLSRVATVLDRLRAGGGVVIPTLGGDFLSPSAIGTARIDGEPIAGRQMVDVLNAIGLSLATIGNHEFDVSEAAFRARVAEARFRLVASNLTDASGQPFPGVARSITMPVDANGRQIRLGVIGLVLDSYATRWGHLSPPLEAARREVAALTGKVDAVIALTHLSLADDQALASAIPEIDVILGGHEHENWMLQRGDRLTPIIKADANARSVAVVTLSFGAANARPTVAHRLQSIDAEVPKQPAAEALVRRWTTMAFDAFRKDGFEPDRVVGRATEPLDGRESVVRNQPGAMTELILSAIVREAAPLDVGIVNGGSIRIDDVVPPGPITEYDTIRILPFGGKVLKVTMDGALLAMVLDAGPANRGTGGFMHLRGATRAGASWQIAGKPIDPAARYRVAMPEYLMTGLESRLAFLTRTNPQVHQVQELRDIRMALIDELRAR